VHGRDTDLLQEVDEFVRSLGVKTVILTQISSQHQTLIQKFFAYGRAARFAIVLISSDDLGVFGESFRHPEGGDRTLKFRARQNVILELGFFYGLLSFENVFPLFRAPDVPFPDFERPSDLDGVLFFEVDDSGQWRDYLKERLKEAGFVIL
jgi:predicted nucleotide-binding protein